MKFRNELLDYLLSTHLTRWTIVEAYPYFPYLYIGTYSHGICSNEIKSIIPPKSVFSKRIADFQHPNWNHYVYLHDIWGLELYPYLYQIFHPSLLLDPQVSKTPSSLTLTLFPLLFSVMQRPVRTLNALILASLE